MCPRRNGRVRNVQQRPRALTLVEVLVALSLTALMAALGGRIAITAAQNGLASERTAAALAHGDALALSLERDVQQRLALSIRQTANLRLTGAPHPVLEFSALAAGTQQLEELHVPLKPALVRYRFQREATGAASIVRETTDRTDSARPLSRQVVATNINDWHAEVRVAGRWTSSYPPESTASPQSITALRVRVTWSNAAPPWDRIFLWEAQP